MKILETNLITKTMKTKIEKNLLKEAPRSGSHSKKILVFSDGSVVIINPFNNMAICKKRVYEIDINKAFKECVRCYDVTNYQLLILVENFID